MVCIKTDIPLVKRADSLDPEKTIIYPKFINPDFIVRVVRFLRWLDFANLNLIVTTDASNTIHVAMTTTYEAFGYTIEFVVEMISVVKVDSGEFVVSLSGDAPRSISVVHRETLNQIVLTLSQGNFSADYNLEIVEDATTGKITVRGSVMTITICEQSITCSPVFTTCMLRTNDDILIAMEDHLDVAREIMGYNDFNIINQEASGLYVYTGNIAGINGNLLTVFTIEESPSGLIFSVPDDNTNFSSVHREGNNLILTLKSIPGNTEGYSAIYTFVLQGANLIGGKLEVIKCERSGTNLLLPPIPAIPWLPKSPGESPYPQVKIEGFMTCNRQNVYQLKISVSTGEEREFIRCNPDFAFVLRGRGNSFVAKAKCLGISNPNQLITYAILRYVFSALLSKPPFNRFDVNLLRQRYAEDFLRKLGESQFSAASQFFTTPLYESYVCLFER
jgi:hypothetical protein